jgi:hypothetical protein
MSIPGGATCGLVPRTDDSLQKSERLALERSQIGSFAHLVARANLVTTDERHDAERLRCNQLVRLHGPANLLRIYARSSTRA